MCPDPKALRSWRAHKGWQTRRDRSEAEHKPVSPPRERAGLGLTRGTRDTYVLEMDNAHAGETKVSSE